MEILFPLVIVSVIAIHHSDQDSIRKDSTGKHDGVLTWPPHIFLYNPICVLEE